MLKNNSLKGHVAIVCGASKGIGAASYYPTPVHKTPFYKLKTKLPITVWAASHVVSLPIHPKVTQKNIEFIAKTMREIL